MKPYWLGGELKQSPRELRTNCYLFSIPYQLENHPKNRISGQRKSGEAGDRSGFLGEGKEEMDGLMAMQDLVAIDRVSSVKH